MCKQLHGKLGKNIPMDLHMEHLNRDLASHLSPNTLGSSLQRAGKALKILTEIQNHSDQQTGKIKESGYHSNQNIQKILPL